MTAFNPDPSETPTNICGAMPINEPKKKFFTLTLKSVGKIYADNANNTEIAGYNSIGFKMSKDLTLFQKNVTPFISIENLLNEDYFDNIRINAFGSRFYEPASGINFVCGLKLQL